MKKIITIWKNHKVLIIGIILFLFPIIFAFLSPNDRYKQISRKCVVEGRYQVGRYEPTFRVFLFDEKNRHFTLETDDYTYFQAYKNRVMYFKLSEQEIEPKGQLVIGLLGISMSIGLIIIGCKGFLYLAKKFE